MRHVVGKAGAGVTKLREDLGVRVDFEEQGGAAGSSASKKKPASKSKVTIKGRKENVEEAKKRIQTQVQRLVRSHVSAQADLSCTLTLFNATGGRGHLDDPAADFARPRFADRQARSLPQASRGQV